MEKHLPQKECEQLLQKRAAVLSQLSHTGEEEGVVAVAACRWEVEGAAEAESVVRGGGWTEGRENEEKGVESARGRGRGRGTGR